MKENNFFVRRMLAMLLVFGMAVVGCVTEGNTNKDEVETSKTTSYSKLELIGNSWTDDNGAHSEWTTERQIKLTDCVPNGAAKPGAQYIVTIAGTTDKQIDNFCIDWCAFDDWKSIAWIDTSRESVSGSFTYKGRISIRPDISESDFNRGYLRIKNTNNPAVSNRGDIEATLTNIRITIEEVALNTNGVPKTIKITGYSGGITAQTMTLFSEQAGVASWPPSAEAHEEIEGQTITYTVKYWAPGRDTGPDWAGIGKFLIVIECRPPRDATKDGSKYVYSVDGTNPTPVDISDEVTVLEWAKFIWLSDYNAG
ncbi:hypothetical protein FACS189450_04660 [Spirochaetia bacterium]|nr:hypothetical protein FACS189450_04660 [Spirochaetia bacterium]